jgi:hypothetical protein
VKKKTKTPNACMDDSAAHDWKLLLEAFRDLTEWALDTVGQLSRDDSDARAAINAVREFVHAWIDGRRSEVPVRDVFTTIATMVDRIGNVSLLGPLHTMGETPPELPALLRVYGAAQSGTTSEVIRRYLDHHNRRAA